MLVVDAVIGSRFSLVQAASQPGFVVDAGVSSSEALELLGRARYALVIADETLPDSDGLSFLEGLRESHPETDRALVANVDGFDAKRDAVERGGLSFLLTKPWSPEVLRRTLRELYGSGMDYATWGRVTAGGERIDPGEGTEAPEARRVASHEVILRGLLAGLNSCESESEVFELLHSELAQPFGTTRWIWLDETTGGGGRLEGDWPVEAVVGEDAFGADERRRMLQARRSARVTRLDEGQAPTGRGDRRPATLGWSIRLEGRHSLTTLVFAERGAHAGLIAMLRDLQGGLQRAIQRIRDAERRADAARALARRVSEELRMPVGALTHAIDRLRGEAERAGLSSEWMDRISSESERVARAVEHLEGEMLSERLGRSATAS